jgi:hypothetical protein
MRRRRRRKAAMVGKRRRMEVGTENMTACANESRCYGLSLLPAGEAKVTMSV